MVHIVVVPGYLCVYRNMDHVIIKHMGPVYNRHYKSTTTGICCGTMENIAISFV